MLAGGRTIEELPLGHRMPNPTQLRRSRVNSSGVR